MDEPHVVSDIVKVAEFVLDLVAEAVRVPLAVRLIVAVLHEVTVPDDDVEGEDV